MKFSLLYYERINFLAIGKLLLPFLYVTNQNVFSRFHFVTVALQYFFIYSFRFSTFLVTKKYFLDLYMSTFIFILKVNFIFQILKV